MNLREHAPLAPFTTLRVGGSARFLIEAHSEKDIEEAVVFAREKSLPLFLLGNGSNILVPDSGINGVVLKIEMSDIAMENAGDNELLIADAGALWDTVVDYACERGIYGIENLAGIPGTVGGAVVQNIGAYGAELSSVFEYADVIDKTTGEKSRIARTEASFAYRHSFFKDQRELIIMRAALRFNRHSLPNLSYPDLARSQASGTPLGTPSEIARAVRSIRAKKFPDLAEEGTAGSFFKNPSMSQEQAAELVARFPGLQVFPHTDGKVKVSLAWLLDHVLSLKGYSEGSVRCYEKHPLIIVTRVGATAKEVDEFAHEVAEKVFNEIGIKIEREVEMFGL